MAEIWLDWVIAGEDEVIEFRFIEDIDGEARSGGRFDGIGGDDFRI